MEELKTETYKGHKIYFIKYDRYDGGDNFIRYWIDDKYEGRTGISPYGKSVAFNQAKRVIDNE